MLNALIGHTGFVGSTLDRGRSFDARFNSSTIDDMAGQRFGRVVCAGVSAVKWLANKEPERDKAGIDRLVRVLETVTADDFVLISTVDVYPSADGADETTPIDPAGHHAYGRHRLDLEAFVRSAFPRSTIVRLPALFGTGLKKNILFDLLNDNGIEKINPQSSFQWYPIERLCDDLDRIHAAGVDLINLNAEPVTTATIAASFFSDKTIGTEAAPEAHYDIRTIHADLFGGAAGYCIDQTRVLAALSDWIATERAARG